MLTLEEAVKQLTPTNLFLWLMGLPGDREFVCRSSGNCIIAEYLKDATGNRTCYAGTEFVGARGCSNGVAPWLTAFIEAFDDGIMGTTAASVRDWMLTTYQIDAAPKEPGHAAANTDAAGVGVTNG